MYKQVSEFLSKCLENPSVGTADKGTLKGMSCFITNTTTLHYSHCFKGAQWGVF